MSEEENNYEFVYNLPIGTIIRFIDTGAVDYKLIGYNYWNKCVVCFKEGDSFIEQSMISKPIDHIIFESIRQNTTDDLSYMVNESLTLE